MAAIFIDTGPKPPELPGDWYLKKEIKLLPGRNPASEIPEELALKMVKSARSDYESLANQSKKVMNAAII